MLRRAALHVVKLAHTLVWFSVESCMIYVLWAGFRSQSDRRAAIAAGVVASESLVFVGNGCRCPLSPLAERLGAERGSVTDVYLPRWFADNLPAIHVPLIMLAGYLHGRNLRQRDGVGSLKSCKDEEGGRRRHHRLFCLLENGTARQLAERGFGGPQIAVINGMVKANASLFSDREYKKHVRDLGKDYLAGFPRSIDP